jgi:ABC-type methionine transport system ATPase subunit
MAEHFRLTFPEIQVTEPVMFNLANDYNVVPNIRRAAIENHFGWMVVQLDGTAQDIAQAKIYLEGLGVSIDSVDGDIVAG